MDLLAWLLLPPLAFFTFFIVIMPEMKGRRLRIAGFGVGLPFLVFLGDEAVGQLYLHTRCALEGGLDATSSVSADGYFSQSDHGNCGAECIAALTRRGFKYYEAEMNVGYVHGKPKRELRHYYLVDKPSGECIVRYGPLEAALDARLVPAEKCIAFAVRPSPQSRYEVSISKEVPIWAGWRMYKKYSYVKDRQSGQLIASYTAFWWWGGWVRNNSFGSNSATVCPPIGAPNSDVREVILAREK